MARHPPVDVPPAAIWTDGPVLAAGLLTAALHHRGIGYVPVGADGKDGRVHSVIVHDTPDPRVFGVECSCGYREIAFWGEPNVGLIIERHYRQHGVETVKVIV